MKTKLLICIIGGSGSGKSTLEDEIIIHDGFSKTVSTTTRLRRDGESNGREYHFVNVDTFKKLIDDDALLEHVEFDENFYGLTKDEFHKNDDHLVFVVEPNGYIQVSKYITDNKLDITPIVVMTDIVEKERFKNMVKRGDNPIKIQERLKKENILDNFAKFGIEPDIRVTKLNASTWENVMNDIYKIVEILK